MYTVMITKITTEITLRFNNKIMLKYTVRKLLQNKWLFWLCVKTKLRSNKRQFSLWNTKYKMKHKLLLIIIIKIYDLVCRDAVLQHNTLNNQQKMSRILSSHDPTNLSWILKRKKEKNKQQFNNISDKFAVTHCLRWQTIPNF